MISPAAIDTLLLALTGSITVDTTSNEFLGAEDPNLAPCIELAGYGLLSEGALNGVGRVNFYYITDSGRAWAKRIQRERACT